MRRWGTQTLHLWGKSVFFPTSLPPTSSKDKRGSHVVPNVGWTRVCDLAASHLQERRQASGPLCPAPGAVGRSSGGTWSPCPTPPSRCAHPCSCQQLNLREEGTHLVPLRGNYNLLPTSSSDRLRLVCPLALWHLFTTSRASQTQQLTRTLGSVMDRLWEVTGQTADQQSVVYISQRPQRRLLWPEPPR